MYCTMYVVQVHSTRKEHVSVRRHTASNIPPVNALGTIDLRPSSNAPASPSSSSWLRGCICLRARPALDTDCSEEPDGCRLRASVGVGSPPAFPSTAFARAAAPDAPPGEAVAAGPTGRGTRLCENCWCTRSASVKSGCCINQMHSTRKENRRRKTNSINIL